MKKVLSILLVFVMMLVFCTSIHAIESLSEHISFTWAWGANKIETDNSITVVSWSGGSNSSFRSSFIVYDLPEDFTYESVKSEVIISFAINSATLNNGEGQAPTAAVVLVDGDKVKEAYNLKSGSAATLLLTQAKNEGVFLGNYKIGKYPRTSRIKNANINEFFEKNPDVKSIGFYVTNLASDGYEGTVNGIASAMTDYEVNFTSYNNYANAVVNMVNDKGEIIDTIEVRDSIGSIIDVPERIDKNGVIWVRDTSESYFLSEDVDIITVTYCDDKGDREKYVSVIENSVDKLVKDAVSEKIDLPVEYVCDDGFVINIEWFSDDESVVGSDGTVYQGTEDQTTQIYAKVWIGKYTSVETKKFTVTVDKVSDGEIEGSLVYSTEFDAWKERRASFSKESEYEIGINPFEDGKFTVAAHVRCDDIKEGGFFFSIGGAECEISADGRLNIAGVVSETKIAEGQWYHIAVTDNAIYINGEKDAEGDIPLTCGLTDSFGYYVGRMDNLNVYSESLSQSVIKTLAEEDYDSPEIEIVSAAVIEGLDGALVRVASHGYEGNATVAVLANVDLVCHGGYAEKMIEEGVNIFSVSVPNMGGGLTKGNANVLLWDSIESMNPLDNEHIADRKYDFGFDYSHPDNHMLNNTFTLMGEETGLYLTSDGLSQRTDDGRWSAPYITGVNNEGYYSLVNENGKVIDGNFAFEQIEGNLYKIKNNDTGEWLSVGVNDKWVLNVISYDEVSKAFASEGFFLLSENERQNIYSVTGQAFWQSYDRREKLKELIGSDYFALGGEEQAERLKKILEYYPSYQINRAVNKKSTGVEAEYTLSTITWTNYTDMENNSKSGYTATVTYEYTEGDVEIIIYARSQNVVKNIAKGLSYMPYQFIKPLVRVTDYYATNNQFKAETGEIFIETNYEVSAENVAVTGAHELGHLIDFAGFRMSLGDYKIARENECTVSGYGNTALGEDFAEFCQLVISCSGDRELLRQVEVMFPGRYAALCKGMCEMYEECMLK